MKAASIIFVAIMLVSVTIRAQAQIKSSSINQRFSEDDWLEDFRQLIAEMESHYADLDWAINDRHMNLPTLRGKRPVFSYGPELSEGLNLGG